MRDGRGNVNRDCGVVAVGDLVEAGDGSIYHSGSEGTETEADFE